jgi:Ca2+-binding RTX toxin-like protein
MPTFDGTEGNDTIAETGTSDTINALGGDDTVTVTAGADFVNGGTGSDRLVVDYSAGTAGIQTSGPTPNTAAGSGGGFDGYYYVSPSQRVDYTAFEHFTITSGAYDDSIATGSGNDVVSSGAGNDLINVGSGFDQADGGDGEDGLSANFSALTAGVSIDLRNPTSSGTFGSFSRFEYFGTITGTGHDDIVIGTAAARNETISLGAGNDSATVFNGYDTINGGTGSDRLVVDYSAGTAGIQSSGPTPNTAAGSGGGFDGYYYVSPSQRVDYTAFEHFTITGGAFDDSIATGSGDDVVSAGAGNDFVNFGSGNDSGDGGIGEDGFSANLSTVTTNLSINLTTGESLAFSNFEYVGTLTTGSGNDSVVTRNVSRSETINLGAGDDSATVFNGSDTVNGGTGSDRLIVDYSAGTAGIQSSGPTPNTAAGSGGGFDGYYYVSPSQRVDYTAFEHFTITGGAFDDVIATGSGNDIVSAGAGNDFVNFGSGNDSGDGGIGEDGFSADLSALATSLSINLTTGESLAFSNFEYVGTLTTGSGNDSVVTRNVNRNETINLGAGDDSATVFNGRDTVSGGTGSDRLVVDYSAGTAGIQSGGPTPNTAAGSGGGFDGFYFVSASQRVDYTAFEHFTITSGAFDDSITTASGDDVVKSGAGNDIVNAAAGNDLVEGGDGNDTLNGGDGTDTLSYATATSGVSVSLAVTISQNTVGAGNDTISNFENILGSAHADTLIGDAGDNLIDGGLGADAMTGGAGNDTYIVDSPDDTVIEAAGDGEGTADEVRTALSSYALPDNVEILNYTGSGSATLRGNAGNNTLNGGSGGNLFYLQDGGNDTAVGGSDRDIFYFGGAFTANDSVAGGGGFDVIVLQGDYAAGVTLDDSVAGIEAVSLQSGSITRWTGSAPATYDYRVSTSEGAVAAGAQLRINGQSLLAGEDLTFDGSQETDGGTFLVYGGYGRDDLTGGSGNDIFYFEAGRFGTGDTVDGGGGRDAVVVSGYGPDPVNPLEVNFASGSLTNVEALSFSGRFNSDPSAKPSYDVVLENGNIAAGQTLIVNASSLGYGQRLEFDGSAVSDGRLEIFGGYGADVLTGGANADTIMGGVGADVLTGGGGADTFRYDRVADSYGGSQDSILRFESGLDRIDLSRIDASVHVEGDQAFRFVTEFSGGGEASAGEFRIRPDLAAPNQWFVEGDVDGDGRADISIALYETPLITAADIVP